MILLSVILWLATGLLLGLSLSAAWWYKFWVFEIVGTGYLWFAGTTLLLLLSLLLVKSLRRKRWLQVVLALSLVFYAEFILWYVPIRDTRADGIPVTVMTYNVNYQLWDTAATEELVRAYPADIFGLWQITLNSRNRL